MIREAFFIHESEIIINLRQQITSWWTPTRLIVTSNDTGSWNLLATVKEAISIPKANTNTAEVITESSGANITSLLFALWLTAAHRSRPTICSVVSFNSFWFVNSHLTVHRICTRLLKRSLISSAILPSSAPMWKFPEIMLNCFHRVDENRMFSNIDSSDNEVLCDHQMWNI